MNEPLNKIELYPTDGAEIHQSAPHLSASHCEFCLEPIQNNPHQWWFVAVDFSCCICESCFHQYQKIFQWKQLDGWDNIWTE